MNDMNDDGPDYDEGGYPVPAAAAPTAIVTNPAQSKIEAVSLLLAKAIGKASELQLTPEETKALKAEFPDEAFRTGAAGKENLLYIEHTHLRERLDEVLGMGQATIVQRECWSENNGKATTVYVRAMLLVRGCFIAEAIGDMNYYPNNASQNYGDAVEGAQTAAFRRCCKHFGIGLQAWSKTWCEGWWRRKGLQSPATSGYDHSQESGNGSPMEACPKCGKTDSVIQGKAEYGGGKICFKKKNGGCGHKWGGVDTNTGEAAAPAVEYPPIMDHWMKKLDDVSTLDQINGQFKTDFAAIPGKHPERAKVWAMILKFASAMGWVHSHGEKKFVQS